MVESALYKALSDYNKQITNNYGLNWGSLLNFIGKSTAVTINSFRRRRHQDFDDQNAVDP